MDTSRHIFRRRRSQCPLLPAGWLVALSSHRVYCACRFQCRGILSPPDQEKYCSPQHMAAYTVNSGGALNVKLDDIAPAHTNDPGSNHPFAIDLDITGRHSLHRLLNTAASVEGSQRLLDWLTNTRQELAVIQHRQQLVQELTPQTLFRNKLLLKSLLTTSTTQSRWEGKQLLRWLETHSNEHGLLPLMFLSMLFSIITLALFVLNLLGLLPTYWIIALVLMIVFLAVTKERRGDLFEEAGYLSDAFAQLSIVFE